MRTLNLKLMRVSNTKYGNPRFRILNYDNSELFKELLNKKYFKSLKKGFFTAPDYAYCYGILNKEGVKIKDIIVKGRLI